MNAPAERPLFISQDKLVQWESEGKVHLNGTLLTLVAERRSYNLTEAVRFLKALDPEPAGQSLVGKVRTKDQLKAMNAEHYMGSVILGERGYEVQEGFVGMVALSGAEVPASFAVAPVTAVAPNPITPSPITRAAPAMPPAAVPTAPATPPPVASAPVVKPAPLPTPVNVVAAPPAAGPSPLAQSLARATGSKPEERTDAELLADFLLSNLNG